MKKITIEQLAEIMEKGFAETRKTIKESIEELAIMTNRAFDDTYKRLDKIDKKFDAMGEQNRREHEEIQLRLTNVAYRFGLEELKHRIEKIERKIESKK